MCIWVSHLVEWGLGISGWETVLFLVPGCWFRFVFPLFLLVLSARFWVLCPSSWVWTTLHSFCLLLFAWSAAPVSPFPPGLPPPAGTDPHALQHAGHQPSQARILTHFWALTLKMRVQARPKERGLPEDRQERWSLASKIRYFEVLELPSLIIYFLSDILFVVLTVVWFGIISVLQSKESLLKELATNSVFVCDGHLRATPKQRH